MPLSPLSNILQRSQSAAAPLPPPMDVDLTKANVPVVNDGVAETETDDGGKIIDFAPKQKKETPTDFNANLAEFMDESELNRIAADLLTGIQNDEQSRAEWLSMYADGIKLLGLIVEEGKGDTGSTSAPLEGMSSVRHPLLLDACLLFQANARGEMLPAAGPVKVRDDRTTKPVGIGHNGGPPLSPMQPQPLVPNAAGLGQAPAALGTNPSPASPVGGTGAGGPGASPGAAPPPIEERDNTAQALETDFNHYLTVTATEYVPDTDRMLFTVGFGGIGIKKVYNCPIRRRPVSESIAMEDFIVSNALTDLANAGRITHRIKMRPSVLKRMQLLSQYRDVPLVAPTASDETNAVEQAKAQVQGVQAQPQDPKDADHTLYETCCELKLDEFAPKHFKDKELALPYRVTMDKESQKILEVRRNWKEDDEQCLAREYFVEFPFVKAFGFYGIGLLHILGNTTKTLTAAWREFIDSGMFANFPGFVYAKGVGRQLTNQFRVPPGGGVGLDVGLGSIRDAVMALPYKDLGPAFTAFIQHVEELGQRLGGTSQTNVSEGRQDAPVGTTLALIEQATKPTNAVLKRLHSAQDKEFKLLKERFKDDPEAFWRFNPRPAQQWQKEQFIKALSDYDLVPVSDPNNPTMLHRAAKAEWLKQTAIAAPGLLDVKKVFLRSAQDLQVSDAEDMLAPPAPQAGPPPILTDPNKMAAIQLKGQELQADQQTEQQKQQFDARKMQLEMQDRQAERQSRENIARMNWQTEQLRLASTLAIHSDKSEAADRALRMKMVDSHMSSAYDQAHQQDQTLQGQQNDQSMSEADRQHAADQAELDRQHQQQLAQQAAKQRTKQS